MNLLKHIKNTDVAICVLKSIYLKDKQAYELKVMWFNIVNPDNIYSLGIKETLVIDRKTFNKDWIEISDDVCGSNSLV